MKKQIFTVTALSLCLLTVPCWAMDEDADINLNKAAKHTNAATTSNAATVEEADDSSSSHSYETESDNEQAADKKSKKFFVYIANRCAAMSYEHIVVSHNFSVRDSNREHIKNATIATAERFLTENKGVNKLCRIMKSALKKFGATQTLRTVGQDGLIVELTTREEQSAKAVAGYCQKSPYVYKVFSRGVDMEEYIVGLSDTPSSSSSASLESALIGALQGMGITMRRFNPNDPQWANIVNRGHTEDNEGRSSLGRDGDGSE